MEPQQAGSMSKMDRTRLPGTSWPFWTCISTSGIVKMMMKNVASRINLALEKKACEFKDDFIQLWNVTVSKC